jgi:hypothetical protein
LNVRQRFLCETECLETTVWTRTGDASREKITFVRFEEYIKPEATSDVLGAWLVVG